MIESHDLFHEFPEHQETIRRLMLSNDEFTRMMRDYDDVDHKIVRIEQRVEAASDLYFEELKKLRVSLKDRLYKMILAAEH
ncbi:MAG: YdcH family protein [Thiobacillaceae bacterium]